MDPGRIRFFLSEVWRNFTRNLVMQLTAIGTVTITILLLGGFLFVRETVGTIASDVVHKIEISVFLSDAASESDARRTIAAIERDRRVKSVVYVSKAEGLRQLRERLRGQIDTSLLTANPLPIKLRVRVVDPARVRSVAAYVRTIPNVARVEYAQDAVEKLLAVSDVLGRIGLGIVTLLVFTAAIIISNTIRLTVFARRREIAIMHLVGASGAYISLPFICEGLIAGLVGAALAVALLALGRFQLLPKLAVALPFVPLHTGGQSAWLLALELLGVGAAVGIVASWFSVGRYLRA
jgi:cell division transport system permease protein